MKLHDSGLILSDNTPAEISELVRLNSREAEADMGRMMLMFGRSALENLQTTYSEHWSSPSAPEMLNYLRRQNVIDLGCGNDPTFRHLLATFEPENYIGVDQFLSFGDAPYEANDLGVVIPLRQDAGNEVEGVLVRGDMLDLVVRLPDDSCSFVVNGIDEAITESQTPYARELVRQIDRATAPGGYIIGVTAYGGILNAFKDMPGYETEVVTHSILDFVAHHKLPAISTA